jgi:adenosylhomocysteine nucleosidase
MPKRGLLFATALEANPLLARLGVSRLEGDARFPVYETDRPSITVLISGMGKVNAALGAAHLVQKYAVEEIWNLGLCGALAPGFSPGDLLRIREAREGDRDPTHPGVETLSLPEGIGPSLPAARLVTVDFPVFDAERRRALSSWGDVVDMEGAAVARAASLWGVSCALLKVVSDLADADGKSHLLSNAARCSERLAEIAIG